MIYLSVANLAIAVCQKTISHRHSILNNTSTCLEYALSRTCLKSLACIYILSYSIFNGDRQKEQLDVRVESMMFIVMFG